MRIEINNKLIRVIFITLAIFALIVSIVIYFLGGDFLLALVGLELGLALAYYIYLNHIKRVVALDLDASLGLLKLIFNKGGTTQAIRISDAQLTFEIRRNNKDRDVEVLVIREKGKVVRTIWPGLTGFVLDDLKALKSTHDEIANKG
ncbi:MAG: hypothetical protein HWE14_13870 [Flavobacteriia bacterium]|nr:hypothetical protein [Flavobacteriia bacterium]